MSLWLRYSKPPAAPKVVEFEEMTQEQLVKFLDTCATRLGLKPDDEPARAIDARIKALRDHYASYHR